MASCLICARNLWRLQREAYDRSRRMLALGALLSGLMDQEEVWKDPDLNPSHMSRLCATNATYLNRVIQQRFGRGFKDLLNAKRVAGVAAQIEQDPEIDIQSAFFNAGYRSRTTAWRNFKDIMGQSPAEYKQALKTSIA